MIQKPSQEHQSTEKPIYEKPVLTNLSAEKTEAGPTAGAENGFSSS